MTNDPDKDWLEYPDFDARESATESPSCGRFIYMAGIEVNVEDLVAIWNGEEILPKLSDREIEIERRARGQFSRLERSNEEHEEYLGDETDMAPLFRNAFAVFRDDIPAEKGRLGKKTLLKLQQNKLKRLRQAIREFYKKGRDREVLSIDRVLSLLNSGRINFDSISTFAAQYSELTAEEGQIVKDSAREIQELFGESLVETRFVDVRNAQNLEVLGDAICQALSDALGTEKGAFKKIPTILLEKAVVGHELLKNEYRELASLNSIGTAKIANLIQRVRTALAGIGLSIAGLGTLSPEQSWILIGGLSTMMAGFAGQLLPTSQMRPNEKLRSGAKKHKKIFEGIRPVIEKMRESPSGQIRLALAHAIIQSTYKEVPADELEKVELLVRHFNGNPQAEEEFNWLCEGVRFKVNEIQKILEEIAVYLSTRDEIARLTATGLAEQPKTQTKTVKEKVLEFEEK